MPYIEQSSWQMALLCLVLTTTGEWQHRQDGPQVGCNPTRARAGPCMSLPVSALAIPTHAI